MKRQAELTRKSLLAAATTIVAEKGAIDFTIDAVAMKAGVSKGALLHHFPSKKELVAAMVKDLVDQVTALCEKAMAEDPEPRGRSARAYVRVIAGQSKQEFEQWAAISAAFLSDMSLIQLWRTSITKALEADIAETDDPTSAMIARLAADGIWSSDIYRTYQFDDARRRDLLDRLVAMTRA
jgi:AcrR family transcriptional regulator